MPSSVQVSAAQTTSTDATSPAHCWGETYTLDAWGNLNSIAATTNSNYTGCTEESGFSTTADGNNHFPIFGYDVSGNTQSDGTCGYTYDAESQIKTAAGVTYLYDGSGRRVSKSSGKLYWYGSGGEILAETTATGATLNEYIFFAGKRVAMLPAGGNAEYYAEDLLGSSRVVTQNNGAVCYDADFYPYGGERAYTNSCPSANAYKFEGKERDTETGNDDFGARYYSNRFGRWLSADWSNVPVAVPYANLTNPQTLNLYAMVADDPESFADLDGHGCYLSLNGGGGISCSGDSWISHAKQGEGSDAPANSGVAAPPDASAAEAQLEANQQANQNANQQAARNGLSVTAVDSPANLLGKPSAEAGAQFTVEITSQTNFAPGNVEVSADLHFSADRPIADGTEVLVKAQAENSQATVGGKKGSNTVNTLLVDVRPYNQTGSFGGHISNRPGANSVVDNGYITFHVKDASGTTRNVQLKVDIISKKVPVPYPGEGWVTRSAVPIPKP